MANTLWNLPNILTLSRITVAPVVFIILLYRPGPLVSFLAALMFALAAITDFLDGYLARRLNMITPFGKFLDPLADKILVGVALIMLIPLERVQPVVVALIIGRELLVTGLRVYAINEQMSIETSLLAKYKTTFQIVAVIGLLLHYTYDLGMGVMAFPVDFQAVGTLLLYIALGITLWTGIDYFYGFFKQAFKK
ncbi:MAG: CDP-diacylglycerol--glycerol-3-phosphate 3-phosphatidyltransferase [Deltaproteobacteria bacterium]|nr:CDP-diacylglycerol--glycerol-3-phosphate 3-phosphatidyltransferase [Deltaproteobacteria bacterium]